MNCSLKESTYEEIKSYYDSVLNVDKSLFKTSNDEPTPISCVEEMIAKIPEYCFEQSTAKWLDPCCGNGNFHIVILQKLLKYHSLEHILTNMLYFNDTNEQRLNVVKTIFCNNTYKLNITQLDFLENNYIEQFDFIVANPPYAKLLPNGKRASKNHNLIGSFLTKSFNILAENGMLLFITPDNWMSFADRNTIISIITSKQILHLDIHTAKRYFKKIGSSFTWYLVENKPAYKPVTISGIWKRELYTSIVESYTRDFIPLYYTDVVDSIFRKTVQAQNKKFNIETSSDLHKYTKRNLIVDKPDDIHIYPLIHTPNTTVYASRPHKYQDGYKVFISTTSYYSTFVDNVGMTQSIAFIRCSSEEEANNIKKILDHPLYRFINNICRWGNFNNIRILQHFPVCNNYESVYEQFNITSQEKEVIEKYA